MQMSVTATASAMVRSVMVRYTSVVARAAKSSNVNWNVTPPVNESLAQKAFANRTASEPR